MDKVTSKATGRVYARKRISRRIFGHDKNAQKVYQNEIKALHKIEKQDHLIRAVGSYTDSKYFALILEPVADMSLKDLLGKGGTPDEEGRRQLQTYFGCLAHTIRYLHGIAMLHKDIKPENVLLKSGRLILTDFGTAFDWSKTGQSMTRSNANDERTPRYQAPEVANAGEFHRSSDIWSLGVVFLEIATVLRGRSLKDMNAFLESRGTKKTAIHENLEIALSWFEPLRASQFGSILDNEPLAWIKRMLTRTFFTRPKASELFDEISAFEDGHYCGGCCLDQADSDEVSQSDGGFLSSISEADEPDEQTQVPIQQRSQDRYDATSQSNDGHMFRQDHVIPGAFPLPYEIISDPVKTSSSTMRIDLLIAPRGTSINRPGSVPSKVTNPERWSETSHKEPSKKLPMVSSTQKKNDVISTVIYILLTAGANPNAASRAGDKPLLMLLNGSGRLPQEKRDALLLLLPPNVDIDLNVTFSGTQDNALHLVVVDAVPEKMKPKIYTSYRLLDQANGSGFTNLLPAFSIFEFSDDEAEELQIIKLLLDCGANPNDQDKGKKETPLHRAVRDIKNAIVLELLCRHSANPEVRNKTGKRPVDLIPKSGGETHSDNWSISADRRMRNTLQADDFRPPELSEYLDEESAERGDHAAKSSPRR